MKKAVIQESLALTYRRQNRYKGRRSKRKKPPLASPEKKADRGEGLRQTTLDTAALPASADTLAEDEIADEAEAEEPLEPPTAAADENTPPPLETRKSIDALEGKKRRLTCHLFRPLFSPSLHT